jgi:uncharacterized protein (DUF1810 family)
VSDPYRLERFVAAQEGVWQQVTQELCAGRKESHWMWFVFPQIRGLGTSPTAEFYAIASAAEARAYLDHPVLGPRLRHCVRLVLGVEGRTANAIFGFPDDCKLRSCLTLFGAVAGEDRVFQDTLDRYFDGLGDPLTIARLA